MKQIKDEKKEELFWKKHLYTVPPVFIGLILFGLYSYRIQDLDAASLLTLSLMMIPFAYLCAVGIMEFKPGQ